jgi:hypothetical protein
MLGLWDESRLPPPLNSLQPWFKAHDMPLILLHWHIILLGFTVSLLVSYAGFYGGPRLFPEAFAKGKPRMRLNFAHQLVSLVHAFIASIQSLYYIFCDSSFMPKDMVWGYSPRLGAQCAFTVGYFLWDLFGTAANIDYYGSALMLHAVIGFFPLAIALSPVLIGYVPGFLMFEVSTLFLNTHWFADKLLVGREKEIAIMINDILLLVTFFASRIVFGWWLIFQVIREVIEHRPAIGRYFFPFLCLTLASSMTLNHFWFYRLFKATLRVLGIAGKHHHHHHHDSGHFLHTHHVHDGQDKKLVVCSERDAEPIEDRTDNRRKGLNKRK